MMMNSTEAKQFIREIFDYQDPDTGLRLVHTGDQHIEPMKIYVGNAEIRNGEDVVGKAIFTYHFATNAFELSRGEMDEAMMGQGVGTRYLPFVYEKMREAGVRYIFATDTTEIAANMYESAGWTEALPELELEKGSYGLDVSKQ